MYFPFSSANPLQCACANPASLVVCACPASLVPLRLSFVLLLRLCLSNATSLVLVPLVLLLALA